MWLTARQVPRRRSVVAASFVDAECLQRCNGRRRGRPLRSDPPIKNQRCPSHRRSAPRTLLGLAPAAGHRATPRRHCHPALGARFQQVNRLSFIFPHFVLKVSRWIQSRIGSSMFFIHLFPSDAYCNSINESNSFKIASTGCRLKPDRPDHPLLGVQFEYGQSWIS